MLGDLNGSPFYFKASSVGCGVVGLSYFAGKRLIVFALCSAFWQIIVGLTGDLEMKSGTKALVAFIIALLRDGYNGGS